MTSFYIPSHLCYTLISKNNHYVFDTLKLPVTLMQAELFRYSVQYKVFLGHQVGTNLRFLIAYSYFEAYDIVILM